MTTTQAPLGEKASRILAYLRERREPYPPTIREIQRAVGLSSLSVVDYNVKKLREAGLLIATPGHYARRVIVLTERANCACTCDCCGARCR